MSQSRSPKNGSTLTGGIPEATRPSLADHSTASAPFKAWLLPAMSKRKSEAAQPSMHAWCAAQLFLPKHSAPVSAQTPFRATISRLIVQWAAGAGIRD